MDQELKRWVVGPAGGHTSSLKKEALHLWNVSLPWNCSCLIRLSQNNNCFSKWGSSWGRCSVCLLCYKWSCIWHTSCNQRVLGISRGSSSSKTFPHVAIALISSHIYFIESENVSLTILSWISEAGSCNTVLLPRHTTASGTGGSSHLQETVDSLVWGYECNREWASQEEGDSPQGLLFPPDLEWRDTAPVSHSMYISLIVFRTVLGSRTFRVIVFVSLSTLMRKDKQDCSGNDHKVLQRVYLRQG